MATLDGYYLNPHVTQFDGSTYEDSACTRASGANGANAATAGHVNVNGAYIKTLVKPWEESRPSTPGWSMPDLDLAMSRVPKSKGGPVPFVNRTGSGWSNVVALHRGGFYLVVQGDSDKFSNNTCSGKFNGLHAIGVHPATQGTQWWIDDPICRVGRWEEATVIRAYAQKLATNIWFGQFTTPVVHIPGQGTTTHVASFRSLATVRIFDLYKGTHPVACIKKPWHDERWGIKPSSAGCQAPISRVTCDGTSSATTVLMTTGKYAGLHIRVGGGVTVKENP